MEWKEVIMTYTKCIPTFVRRNWNSMSPLRQNRLFPFQDLLHAKWEFLALTNIV
jgi:hypothetical protein